VNLLLYRAAELESETRLTLPAGDRRLEHLRGILKLQSGDRLRVGRLGGARGWARLLEDPAPDRPCPLQLEETEAVAPWTPPRRILLLALPRPPALRRILQLAPQLGLERILLTGSARVEKSYFHSPLLSRGEWREQLELGLEQAQETRLPEVLLFPQLHVVLQQELERWLPAGAARLLPHPGPWPGVASLQGQDTASWCLAVGPEGGWVEPEVQALCQRGFQPLSLGGRILKVEAALQRLVAQLDLLEALKQGAEQ
jgi:RsmE family RNA methyltransferase